MRLIAFDNGRSKRYPYERIEGAALILLPLAGLALAAVRLVVGG